MKKNYKGNIIFVSPYNIIQHDIAKELNAVIIGKNKGYFWEQIELPLYLRKKGNPLLVNFASMAPVFYFKKISTLHDITYIRYPQTFSWKFRYLYKLIIPLILKTSKHIFTVSKFSQNEIIDYYKIASHKISIIYNAVDDSFKPIKNNNRNKEDYILAVSSVKGNKNFSAVINSFFKIYQNNKNIKLYIIGDFESDSFKNIDITKFKENPNVVFLGRVTDKELIEYYSNAKIFIFPSFYEGFGIPVLEAQACGCPVVSSNTSSLPEVLEDSAILCKPLDINAFSEAILQILEDTELSISLRLKGFENIKRFSWEKSSMMITETLNRLTNHL